MDQADLRVSRTAVDGLDDEALFWAVIDPIWSDASIEDELAHVAKATVGQRAVFATTLFAREVDNGGLAQFLGNSSGVYTNTVIEGLQVLGADDLLEAFLTGLDVFPSREVPVDWEVRRQHVYRLSPSQLKFLDGIDDSLYRGSGLEERLRPYFKRYIQAHPAEFFKD